MGSNGARGLVSAAISGHKLCKHLEKEGVGQEAGGEAGPRSAASLPPRHWAAPSNIAAFGVKLLRQFCGPDTGRGDFLGRQFGAGPGLHRPFFGMPHAQDVPSPCARVLETEGSAGRTMHCSLRKTVRTRVMGSA